MRYFSSSVPPSTSLASPLIVAEILLSADVFKVSNKAAIELGRGSGGGEPPAEGLRPVVGGRCDTQSWTRRDTFGFCRRLLVFLEEGLVVITIVGVLEYGVDGR